MRRILRIVNILIAIVCVVAGAGFYWIFYRALPASSGSVPAPVTQQVEVRRDSLGIPHIKAGTLEDALAVQGYVTAEDRMFQMDAMRRLAAGELAEVFGTVALESDREARRLRTRRIAEQIYATMPPADKAAMAAYARGVNAYIESHRGRYGLEFTVLRYDPRPWSVVDSVLCGLNMYRSLTHTWKGKIEKAKMLEGGEADKVDFLFRGPTAAASPGSNAWAVSGAHSADGKPLLSNDMHLEFSVPGVWHAVQIEAPGLDAEGVALPGLPGVISGHNDRIAWGETNLGFDVEDLYLEKMDLRNGRYLYEGKPEQARLDRELLLVKGHAPEELDVWVTRHGPVFQQSNQVAMSIRWVAAEPGLFQYVFLDIDRARNWDEFRKAVSRYAGPSQNFVYADVDGHIGYQAAGALPIRHFQAGVPLDGSNPRNEWAGYIPFEELPRQFDPPDGIIASANANPFPANYPYQVDGNFASPDRVEQIRDLLSAGGSKLTPQDSLRIQKDVYSALNMLIARQLVAAYDKRGAVSGSLNDAIELLRHWDGQMDKDHAAPVIAELVFEHLRKSVGDRASGGNGAVYTSVIAPAVIETLLRTRPKDWFGDYDALLLQSFADAMDEGQRLQGSNPKSWKWGRQMYIEVRSPVGGALPVIGSWFNIGPLPMSGSGTTVKQMTARLGPSERMNYSLGNWDHSLWNLFMGESGRRASWHYRDQFDAWYYGNSFPMPFHNVETGSEIRFVPAGK
ncbi:MAG TPA: penicillin acylase family protein [Bryobacteraceae bacterium]|nr:penicillin acylase family protein [Bryobacteraceae bacterium]